MPTVVFYKQSRRSVRVGFVHQRTVQKLSNDFRSVPQARKFVRDFLNLKVQSHV